MKIVQFHLPGIGQRVGIVEGADVIDITTPSAPTTLGLVVQAGEQGKPLAEIAGNTPRGAALSYAELSVAPAPDVAHLLMPIDPPEIWGAGITYERTATRYDEGAREETIYTRVYESDRPEIFFKSTAPRAVGPNAPIAVRADSEQTSTEPEMAILLGVGGEIIAVTCCNDVTARDIELENPLYLPQAKTYSGSCAFGPTLVTLDEIPDPHGLEITCTIERGSESWSGAASTGRMKRRVGELVSWLMRDNPIPAGTVFTTGTGIVPPVEWCLLEGDVVRIEIGEIGELSNPVHKLA
ncbi:MAG TPA: fumarylacetoacetate hydrolase family protein [Armatimonadota bacterium]|nr:fumarylacetoacetate hydrolase family protein [Armatimonadota bacterium]